MPSLRSYLLILLFVLPATLANACSMYKITINGTTMVGNNEDSWRLTSGIWFEQGNQKRLGVAYVGYLDKQLPDGAMNEAGLVFDAFTMHSKTGLPERDPAKKDFGYADLKTIMQQYRTVDEVYAFLQNLNLQTLNGSVLFHGGMLLFVDRTGKYLVVEANKLSLGNDPKFLLANFSFADTKDLGSITMERYCKGKAFLKDKIDTSLTFCTALSDTMSVNREKVGDGTLYTTIYDLNAGIIYVYFFHDYKMVRMFDLKEELLKADHAYSFSELFPENEAYLKFKNYKTPQNSPVIFGLLAFGAALFAFSGIYFLVGFIRKKQQYNRYLGLVMALLCLAFSPYLLTLLREPSVFYFPSPYHVKGAIWINLTSYLPFVLVVLLVPLLIKNIRVLRNHNWSRFSAFLLSLNNLAFVCLLTGFVYWGMLGF